MAPGLRYTVARKYSQPENRMTAPTSLPAQLSHGHCAMAGAGYPAALPKGWNAR